MAKDKNKDIKKDGPPQKNKESSLTTKKDKWNVFKSLKGALKRLTTKSKEGEKNIIPEVKTSVERQTVEKSEVSGEDSKTRESVVKKSKVSDEPLGAKESIIKELEASDKKLKSRESIVKKSKVSNEPLGAKGSVIKELEASDKKLKSRESVVKKSKFSDEPLGAKGSVIKELEASDKKLKSRESVVKKSKFSGEDSKTGKSVVKESKKSDTKLQSKGAAVEKPKIVDESLKFKKSIAKKSEPKGTLKLEGLFGFKMSMTTFYNEKGESVPVTALKYEPCRVSQIKTKEKDSYQAFQLAFKAQKNKRCSKSLVGHLKPAGFKEGARFLKEIRQDRVKNGVKPGEIVSIESLKKGDRVKISSFSKGKGFSGVMKRWNFAGGKASHGSKSHRRTGSIGQHTEPARVMPGRKMPGQYGFKRVSLLNVPVVEVFPEEGIIFVKGPVPGARNTLVSLRKMPSSLVH